MNETPSQIMNRIAAKVRSYQQIPNLIAEKEKAFREIMQRLETPLNAIKLFTDSIPEFVQKERTSSVGGRV